MPNLSREWFPDTVYHIYSRGNKREAIFREPYDYEVFLRLLQSSQKKHGFTLHALCLMTNHFHLALEPSEAGITAIMRSPLFSYSRYFNKKYGLTGHVFESRFQSKPLKTDEDFLKLSKYIHLNPVRAGLAKTPEAYPYSSYFTYVTPEKPLSTATYTIRSLIDTTRTLDLMDSSEYRIFTESEPAESVTLE